MCIYLEAFVQYVAKGRTGTIKKKKNHRCFNGTREVEGRDEEGREEGGMGWRGRRAKRHKCMRSRVTSGWKKYELFFPLCFLCLPSFPN